MPTQPWPGPKGSQALWCGYYSVAGRTQVGWHPVSHLGQQLTSGGHLQWSGDCDGIFTAITYFNNRPMVQMKKLRSREVKQPG